MYRRWTPRGRSSTFLVEQFVLPKRCRGTVLKLTHDVPLASHLGREKTGCRLLRRFYWPMLFKDMAEFCRGCPICQRSAQGKIKPAPLVPLLRLFTELGITTRMQMHCLVQQDSLLQQKENGM